MGKQFANFYELHKKIYRYNDNKCEWIPVCTFTYKIPTFSNDYASCCLNY